VYKDGWKAETYHHPDIIDLTRYGGGDSTKYGWDKDVWELYDLSADFNERVNLAGRYPEKLAELKAQFDADAVRYHIYPLIDWEDVLKRRIHNVPGRPFAGAGGAGGMTGGARASDGGGASVRQ
jgi:arylsulfatase